MAMCCFIALQACKTKQDITSVFLVDQVELSLAGRTQPERIIASFPTYGLEYVCTLNKSTNTVIFSFDTDAHTRDEVVSFLSKEVGIKSASKTKGCPNQ